MRLRIGYSPPSTQAQIFTCLMLQQIPKFPSTAPAPVAGANTFFGTREQDSTPAKSPVSTTSSNTTPSKRRGLFNIQPKLLHKNRFQEKLQDLAVTLLQPDAGAQTSRSTAQQITTNVQDELRLKDRGFLPENQQWQTLTDLLDNERFARAVLAGTVSVNFLANATRVQLTKRLQTLNDLSYEEFHRRLLTQRGSEVSHHLFRYYITQLTVPGTAS